MEDGELELVFLRMSRILGKKRHETKEGRLTNPGG